MVFSVLILYFDTLLYDFPLVASLSLPGLESPAEMHDAKLKVEVFCAGHRLDLSCGIKGGPLTRDLTQADPYTRREMISAVQKSVAQSVCHRVRFLLGANAVRKLLYEPSSSPIN
jgi:hypothetical protein